MPAELDFQQDESALDFQLDFQPEDSSIPSTAPLWQPTTPELPSSEVLSQLPTGLNLKAWESAIAGGQGTERQAEQRQMAQAGAIVEAGPGATQEEIQRIAQPQEIFAAQLAKDQQPAKELITQSYFGKIPGADASDPRFRAFITGTGIWGPAPTQDQLAFTAAAVNTAKGLGEFMTSPLGVSTAGLGAAGGPIAHRIIGAGFLVDMFKNAPEQFRNLGETEVLGTDQQKWEARLGALATAGFVGLLGAGQVKGGIPKLKQEVGEVRGRGEATRQETVVDQLVANPLTPQTSAVLQDIIPSPEVKLKRAVIPDTPKMIGMQPKTTFEVTPEGVAARVSEMSPGEVQKFEQTSAFRGRPAEPAPQPQPEIPLDTTLPSGKTGGVQATTEKGPTDAISKPGPDAVVEAPSPAAVPRVAEEVRPAETPPAAQAEAAPVKAPEATAKPVAPFAMYMGEGSKAVALYEVPGARPGWKNHVGAEKARQMGFEPEPVPSFDEWKQSRSKPKPKEVKPSEEKVQGQEVARPEGAAESKAAAPVQKQPWEMTAYDYENSKILSNLAKGPTGGFSIDISDWPSSTQKALGDIPNAWAFSPEGKNKVYLEFPKGLSKQKASEAFLETIQREHPTEWTDHREIVETALREGKPVPPEVLKDYPDLKPKPDSGQSLGIVPPGAARISAAIHEADIPGWFARNLTKERGLPPELYADWLKRVGTANEQAVQALYAVRDLEKAVRKHVGVKRGALGKKVDPQLLKDMNEALAGARDINTLPEQLRDPIQSMRDHIDSLSRQMIREGLVDSKLQAIIGENLGTYLNRSYRVFEDPKWTYDKIPIDIKNKARSLIQDELGLTPEQAESHMRDLFNDWKQGGVHQMFSPRRLGSKDLSLLRKRKTIDPEIRALMGEYKDPFINYQRSIAKMSRLIADQQFLNEVRRQGLGRFLFEEGQNPVGFNSLIAAEGSAAMSPLNGLRTSERLAKVFNEWGKIPNEAHPLLKFYYAANALSKMSKTVYSPMTQSRNLLSQPFFWMLNGHYNLGALKQALGVTLSKLGANDATWREYHQKLARLNLLDESVFAGELRESIRDFSKKLADQNIDPMSYGLATFMKKWLKDMPQEAYKLSDELGKIVGFESELARIRRDQPALPVEAAERLAANRVRNTYPTYSNVPKVIQDLRRVPVVGPYMPFAYESLRTTGHALYLTAQEWQAGHIRSFTERSVGALLALGASTFGIQALSRHLLGLTKDDDRDMRRQLPPWEKNSAFLYTGKDKTGISRINISYSNPYSYMIDPIIAAINGDEGSLDQRLMDAATEFLRPWTTEQMLIEAIADVARNQTVTGERVYNPQAPKHGTAMEIAGLPVKLITKTEEEVGSTQWDQKLAHLFSAIEPGGLTRLKKRIIPAAQGRPDARGTLTQELLAEASGYREVKHDFLKQLSFSGRKFREDSMDATRLFSEGLGSPKPSPDILQQYKDMDEARFRLWTEMHRDVQAARRQGIEEAAIFRALVDAGLSQTDAAWLRRGKYRPYFPTNEVRARANRVGKQIPIKEIADIYRQRIKMVLN